jgi:hypothetical protein
MQPFQLTSFLLENAVAAAHSTTAKRCLFGNSTKHDVVAAGIDVFNPKFSLWLL